MFVKANVHMYRVFANIGPKMYTYPIHRPVGGEGVTLTDLKMPLFP